MDKRPSSKGPAPGLHILISGAGAEVLAGPTLRASRGRSPPGPPPWALAGRRGPLPPPFLSRSGQGRSGEAAGAALSLAEEEGAGGAPHSSKAALGRRRAEAKLAERRWECECEKVSQAKEGRRKAARAAGKTAPLLAPSNSAAREPEPAEGGKGAGRFPAGQQPLSAQNRPQRRRRLRREPVGPGEDPDRACRPRFSAELTRKAPLLPGPRRLGQVATENRGWRRAALLPRPAQAAPPRPARPALWLRPGAQI